MSVRVRRWKDPNGTKHEAWMIDVRFKHPDGRYERIRMASPVNTRRGAEEYERRLLQSLLNGTYGKERDAKGPPTFEAFTAEFLIYAENNNKPSTLANKKFLLREHLSPYFGKLKLDEIDISQVEKFKAQMRNKPSRARQTKEDASRWAVKKRYGQGPKLLSPKTINNALSVLHTMLVLANERGELKHLPRIKLLRTAKSPTDFLSFEEADRLVEAADPVWQTMILVALKSGLRLGELIGLEWTDVDLHTGRINVRRTIWRGHEGTPKGGRSRTVDVPASVVTALKAHRHLKSPYVFCRADGRHLTEGDAKWPLYRALRKSGISRPEGQIGWHDLRHTYGSHLAMRGVPLKVIQELMGHASIEMTMRYAHLSDETKRDAVHLLDAPAPKNRQAGTTWAHGGHMKEQGPET